MNTFRVIIGAMIMAKQQDENGNLEAPTTTTELSGNDLEKARGGTAFARGSDDGGIAGRGAHSPISITRQVNASSPQFLDGPVND